jgi:hypothetical protein
MKKLVFQAKAREKINADMQEFNAQGNPKSVGPFNQRAFSAGKCLFKEVPAACQAFAIGARWGAGLEPIPESMEEWSDEAWGN